MPCPLCRRRPARRRCPALTREICPVCCGTKREVEIRCPETCPYLHAARNHPPAVERRQAEVDLQALAPVLQGLNEPQARLLSVLFTVVAAHRPDGFLQLTDADLAECVAALAASYETADRGLIYDQQPASAAAARLALELREAISRLGEQGWRRVERDAAAVLRRVEAGLAASSARRGGAADFLALVGRTARSAGTDEAAAATPPPSLAGRASGLILPGR